MAVSDSLSKDINRLVRPVNPQTPLQRVRQAEAIGRARGRGVPSGNPSATGGVADVRREVLTVYSSLIITEDGAFEAPPNWPIDGDYTAGWTAIAPLPGSLILSGSVLSLDTGVQYYEQRRVHYMLRESLKANVESDGSVSYSDSTILEEQLYVPLAAPYIGSYFQGVVGYTAFTPTLYVESSAVTANPQVEVVRQQLLNAGVLEG